MALLLQPVQAPKVLRPFEEPGVAGGLNMRPLRIVIAIISFVLYTWAVLVVDIEKPSGWIVEADYELPFALSYVVYRTPLTFIDSNVLERFRSISSLKKTSQDSLAVLVRQAVKEAATGKIPAGNVLSPPNSGNGIGWPMFASFAMLIFGLRLEALHVAFLLIMGLSAASFLVRFQDSRATLVPVTFSALTLMLATPLAADPFVASQVPLGGIRYFSMAGMLPLFHFWFEIQDRTPVSGYARWWRLALLGLQAAILTFVMLARVSFVLIVLLLVLFAVLRVCRSRRGTMQPSPLLVISKLGFAALVSVSVLAIFLNLPASEKQSLFGSLWHRAFVSLAFHPAWPFEGLREKYDCTYAIPEGFSRVGSLDRNAHCVWVANPLNRFRRSEDVNADVHSPAYELVLRDAFFEVMLRYPGQIIGLMLKERPLMVLSTLKDAVRVDWANIKTSLRTIIVLQIGLFMMLVLVGVRNGTPQITRSAAFTLVLALFSLPVLLLAWSVLWTSIELIFAVIASGLVLFGFLLQAAGFWLQIAAASRGSS